MTKGNPDELSADQVKSAAVQVRLPGFLIENDVGLGDVIKRASSLAGIRSCAGCERRAAVLNGWLSFRSNGSKWK
jgi:hypothetical protein